MARYILLLRGINVGGHNRLPMSALKAAMESHGFSNLASYIQSGNLVGDYASDTPETVAGAASALIRAQFGFEVPVIALTLDALRVVAAACPFPTDDGKAVHLWFTDTTITGVDTDKLAALQAPGEVCQLGESVCYLYAPDGIGRSKLAAKLPVLLGGSATARNYNTVARLLGMV